MAKNKKPSHAEPSHKSVQPDRYHAARLEGKVENRGIKNLGKQARKGKHGNR